jgi:phospho-N-acetylmuramoyl-pentapeptide-transferase
MIVLSGIAIYYFINSEQGELIPLALTMFLAVLNGMIGFVDDYCKLIKKQNEGLKPYQKLFLQVLCAALYILALKLLGYIDTELSIPFTSKTVELGIVYYVFAMFLIVGMVNSANLTDGIDGLASSVTLVISGFFAFVAFNFLNTSLTLISGALIGALIGFLIYNIHPAKVFMGDTGSLFLGGAVTGAAFIINEPVIILIAGSIYVIEALSVILQVGSFKLRNKRIFKMAPIHHHFEKCGWSEGQVVTVFSVFTVLTCVVAWLGL